MANNYFRFKQFTVYQEKCSMKVCTDSCLFGAWLVNYIHSTEARLNHVLDIGSGSGLLSLMIAQNTTAKIDAVEIEPDAAKQTLENFSNSPWGEKLVMHNLDINNFSAENKFDLILCNPPFYKKSLRSANIGRNLALHDTGLSLEALINFTTYRLSEDGISAVLIPYSRTIEFENIVGKHHLFIKHRCFVKQTEKHTFFRSMFILSNKFQQIIGKEEITIKENGGYSPPFINLLKEYYLNI